MLLRLRNGKSAYVVHLSLEQARILAVEMRGLATDHCPLHHLAVRVAEGLHAKISHIVIKPFGEDDHVAGILQLATATGLHSIQVDAAAGLAMAIHMGMPIFMDGEFSPVEPERDGHTHDVHGLRSYPELDMDTPTERESENQPADATPIPQAFQELIEGLNMPDGEETSYEWPAPGEEP